MRVESLSWSGSTSVGQSIEGQGVGRHGIVFKWLKDEILNDRL